MSKSQNLVKIVKIIQQTDSDALEPMLSHRESATIVHWVVGEHSIIIETGFNQDNIDVRILNLKALDVIPNAGVHQRAHRLVDDGLHALFADVMLFAGQVGRV